MGRPARCEHPAVGSDTGTGPRVRQCGKRAAVEVRYLGDVNFLCAEHHAEASQFNTYQADEVAS